MAGVSMEAGSSIEGGSSGQNQLQCQSGEASNEWRSLEQVENGTPSTSPPYWDIDNDEDGGQKPSELYGKHTWKIEKFSQINKRELRSNVFEVGGYKWYILIYPQGCDVCNHLSLFLCVANHDKLLPGWSHFAQFTIAVVNKDAKKSKYSDTLHRFWKKEHDWGWKKFMELAKVMDGFIDNDSLVIKAQVQVIRERADRPFRCLDCQYRRELVRVYSTNVEQICRRFVEDRRMRLGKLIEDKARWSSFCAFWLGMEQSNRRRMSRERTESILKVVVKNFFIEKEVTSTLVMDSLYSGLKALEGQNKGKKIKGKYADADELPTPIILIEEDTFVLMDDVLILLERAAMEPLPPKDDKGPQNRTKDEAAGEEFNKDSVERDEKRLTELGRRTIEIFVLSHIFSKIEVAYQEAVALKRQEELIREEEAAAAWVTEIDHKSRRGGAAAADKKSKKKQGKHKKNNRKGKDKSREEKLNIIEQDKHELDAPSIEFKDLPDESDMVVENSEAMEDVSDAEALPLDSEERDVSPVNWDTDTSEPHPPTEASSSGISVLSGLQNSPSVVDDSSSTCSSDSVPSVVLNVPHMGNYRNQKNQKFPTRGAKSQGKVVYDNWVREEASQASEAALGAIDASQTSKLVENPTQADLGSSKDRVNGNDRRVDKEERTRSTNRNSAAKDVNPEPSTRGTPSAASPPLSPSKNVQSSNPPKSESKVNVVTDPVIPKKSLSTSPKLPDRSDRSASISSSSENATASKPDNALKLSTPKPAGTHPVSEKTSMPPMPVMSRPLSAPLVPAPRPPVSIVQTSPALSRSASAAGRLGPEPSVSASSPSYVPQSYRNAIIGSNVTATSSAYTPNYSRVNTSNSYSPTPRPLRMDANPVQPMFSFGMPSQHEPLPNGPRWMDVSQSDHVTLLSDMQNLNIYNQVAYSRPHDHFPSEFPPVATSARQNHHAVTDEFPHLDIINDLLDDEYVYGNAAGLGSGYPSFNNGPHGLNRQFSFPGDLGLSTGLGRCRFERTRSYQDGGFQNSYGAPGSPYDMIPQVSPSPYLNGQMEGLLPNQWQIPGSDLPFQGVMNTDSDPYPYHHVPDHPNLSVGANGYSVFRPSNGH